MSAKLITAVTVVVLVVLMGALPKSAFAQTASLLPTLITVTSRQNPASSAQTVTITATVESMAPNAGLPTGTIEFFAGPMSMGKATLVNANGLATGSVTVQMAAGVYPILARYYGDSNFAFGLSIPPLTQQVLGQ